MNILLIIVAVVLAWRMYVGFRRGMVKEVISCISLIVMSLVLVLLSLILKSYVDKAIVNIIIAVILLLILCIVHRLVGIIFFSAKVISKLPVVSTLNKCLGALFGIVETIVFVWVVYTLFYIFDMGMIKDLFFQYVSESRILTVLFEHNILLKWVNVIMERLKWTPVMPTLPDLEKLEDVLSNTHLFQ